MGKNAMIVFGIVLETGTQKWMMPECIKNIAVTAKDHTLYQIIPETSVSTLTIDFSNATKKTISRSNRDICIEAYAVETNNPQICKQLSDELMIETCEMVCS